VRTYSDLTAREQQLLDEAKGMQKLTVAFNLGIYEPTENVYPLEPPTKPEKAPMTAEEEEEYQDKLEQLKGVHGLDKLSLAQRLNLVD
jgi:hypothetical protein